MVLILDILSNTWLICIYISIRRNNLRINWLKKKIKQEIKEFDGVLEDYFIVLLIQKQLMQNQTQPE
jgi:hypothetical protein